MTFWEWVKIALKSIGANKLRSVLTMLGIIIGVGAVIALVAVGQGASQGVSARFESMGAHLILIRPVRSAGGELFIEDAYELEERVPTIEFAVPALTLSTAIKYQTESYDTSVEGVTAGLPEVRNHYPELGRFLIPQEVEMRSRVVVLGQTVVKELFGSQNPLEKTVYIKGQPFVVVGVMEAKGAAMGGDSDDIAYIPVTTAQRLSGTNSMSTIYAKAKSADDAKTALNHITLLFNRKFPRPDAVRITSQDELLSAVGETSQTFTVLLGAIASISLLVGGIGIMNIMLVSVTERTREIGIRKAIGAKKRDVMGQFLIESILLSVVGGILGSILGVTASRFISRFAGWPTVISPGSVILAFSFAVVVGLFFGVYPAQKAAALDPIEALRHE
ncbi:MAG: ABC transporter permease [Bacillota bacterium]|nr:ABC transporter permease [Bacillota bacterium]